MDAVESATLEGVCRHVCTPGRLSGNAPSAGTPRDRRPVKRAWTVHFVPPSPGPRPEGGATTERCRDQVAPPQRLEAKNERRGGARPAAAEESARNFANNQQVGGWHRRAASKNSSNGEQRPAANGAEQHPATPRLRARLRATPTAERRQRTWAKAPLAAREAHPHSARLRRAGGRDRPEQGGGRESGT